MQDLVCETEIQTEVNVQFPKRMSREERDENSGSRGDRSSQRSDEKGRRGGAASEGEQFSVLGKRRRHDPLEEEDKRPSGSRRKRSKRLRDTAAFEGSSSRGRRREDKWEKLLTYMEREESRLHKDVAEGRTSRGEKETEQNVKLFRREVQQ